ncbi:MAG TPA: hypothetical protein VFU88_02090 [Ktedonobacterales bacterium]|nr:hypothetical protein [Ktedonobacterales bacterium]
MIGFHLPELIFLVFLASMLLVPWIIGFAWIVPDANRRGQPGWMWGLAALFLGWIAVLAYLVARAFR